MARTETVFQPMYLEFLPREIKAQNEKERGGWGGVVKVAFRSGAKPWLRYIPGAQSRDIARPKIRVMDAQAVNILKIYGKGKRFWEGIFKLLPVTYCHETFAWSIASENMFLIL